MKVVGPGSLNGAAPRRVERRSGGKGGGFRVAATEEQSVQRSQATQGASQVGALLALQEVPDADERPARAARRGADLLDMLDSLRMEMLLGRVPRQRLERISATLAQQRGRIADPVLAEVVQEIEVRAAVELAKFAQARAAIA